MSTTKRPDHYTILPHGVQCRGLCGWQELDPLTGAKSYWCCGGKGFDGLRLGVKPDYVTPPGYDHRAEVGGGLMDLRPPPVSIRLPCPMCSTLHIDEGKWAHKPHHTHACQHCGHVWRPAVVDTVGVQFLPGFKNDG